jgi:amino acid transporter
MSDLEPKRRWLSWLWLILALIIGTLLIQVIIPMFVSNLPGWSWLILLGFWIFFVIESGIHQIDSKLSRMEYQLTRLEERVDGIQRFVAVRLPQDLD